METLLARVTYYNYDADKITEARKAAGLSQQDIADKTGMSYVTVCRIEKKRNASFEAVERICRELNLPVSEVVTKSDDPGSVHPSRKNFIRKPT